MGVSKTNSDKLEDLHGQINLNVESSKPGLEAPATFEDAYFRPGSPDRTTPPTAQSHSASRVTPVGSYSLAKKFRLSLPGSEKNFGVLKRS